MHGSADHAATYRDCPAKSEYSRAAGWACAGACMQFRPGTAGSVPAGSVPAGSVPAGSVPAGSVPAGSVPRVQYPPYELPPEVAMPLEAGLLAPGVLASELLPDADAAAPSILSP